MFIFLVCAVSTTVGYNNGNTACSRSDKIFYFSSLGMLKVNNGMHLDIPC